VGIGTVADIVPLVEENRVLVRFGLQTIAATDRPGLRALLETARVNPEYISSDDIAFRVAPLLNAAGRMGDAASAVELLTTHEPARAGELADHLRAENRRRRSVQSSTCREALAMVEEDPALREGQCIVLHKPDWHQGIVGLVASRLAERYWRPAFVLTGDGGLATGSARSIGGFPLYTAIERCADLLERFGGHEAAAGLTLAVGKVAEFARRVNAVAAELAPEETPEPELRVDGEFDLSMLSLDLMRELDRLGPFGKGNPSPLFAASGLRVVGNPRTVGRDGRHLSFMVRQGQTTMRTFAPGKADWLDQMRDRQGQTVSLAYEPSINRWRGNVNVELRAEDLRWDADACA
jgi:single-stranded-DNA-specific exonuclease